ncbi:hypothetical protein HUJ05_010378 [Dendroctonus ponderosae]|nr:hypothetical protein HUJ05_010378 [Dendroctonus ponderosae]
MVRETRHLWVGNLPENIREDRIREHFKRFIENKVDRNLTANSFITKIDVYTYVDVNVSSQLTETVSPQGIEQDGSSLTIKHEQVVQLEAFHMSDSVHIVESVIAYEFHNIFWKSCLIFGALPTTKSRLYRTRNTINVVIIQEHTLA